MSKQSFEGRKINEVDLIVGRNLKAHRLRNNLSQAELASRIGVTFQQIHKYESATNRIGSGRLFKLAQVLRIPVNSLFEGAKVVGDGAAVIENPSEILAETGALEMMRAFRRVEASKRRLIIGLAEILADGPAPVLS
jgi:transcriptional regulator with XRE-family HTH domain